MAKVRRPLTLVTRSVPRMSVRRENTVLLIQDMQGFLVEPETGIAAVAGDRGVSTEFDEYFEQIPVAVANIANLRAHLADLGIPTCYTRWISDRPAVMSPLQRALDILPEAEDAAAEIIDLLTPADNPDVFDKGGMSAFSAPSFSSALIERRIENIILCGVITEFGLQATALQAMDLGYRPMIVGDCCAAMTFATNELTLDGLSFGIAKVRPWQELCYGLEELKRDDVAVI